MYPPYLVRYHRALAMQFKQCQPPAHDSSPGFSSFNPKNWSEIRARSRKCPSHNFRPNIRFGNAHHFLVAFKLELDSSASLQRNKKGNGSLLPLKISLSLSPSSACPISFMWVSFSMVTPRGHVILCLSLIEGD